MNEQQKEAIRQLGLAVDRFVGSWQEHMRIRKAYEVLFKEIEEKKEVPVPLPE